MAYGGKRPGSGAKRIPKTANKKVRAAFHHALETMGKQRNKTSLEVLSDLFIEHLTSDDLRDQREAIKLVLDKETKLKGEVKHEHKHTYTETQIVEALLSESEHLTESDFKRLALGLCVDTECGTAESSSKH